MNIIGEMVLNLLKKKLKKSNSTAAVAKKLKHVDIKVNVGQVAQTDSVMKVHPGKIQNGELFQDYEEIT